MEKMQRAKIFKKEQGGQNRLVCEDSDVADAEFNVREVLLIINRCVESWLRIGSGWLALL